MPPLDGVDASDMIDIALRDNFSGLHGTKKKHWVNFGIETFCYSSTLPIFISVYLIHVNKWYSASNEYPTHPIITHSWFETLLDHKPRILGSKIKEFPCLVQTLSVIVTALIKCLISMFSNFAETLHSKRKSKNKQVANIWSL